MQTPTISVIIPVHNGGSKFISCLKSIAACAHLPKEIITVADGDSDGSWRAAEKFATKIIRIPDPSGPARARNLGAANATGDILFFVDADVAVPENAVDLLTAAFQQDSDLSALFGSYDDSPFEANFLSQYKNLFHHYVHQSANEEAATFWTGCGAVRREIFLELGGFDETYRRPCIEDIELGYRLKRAGHKIRLLKRLQVKHLKHWGALSMLRADIFSRALPWTDLILRESRFINDLNLKVSDRLSVALVYLLSLCMLGAFLSPVTLIAGPPLMAILLWLNRDFYRFFLHRRGLFFTVRVIPWHWFYFFYSGMAFAVGGARHLMNNRHSAASSVITAIKKRWKKKSGKAADG
jgi:glycosyltransferase involved in cell wall biosynthesis